MYHSANVRQGPGSIELPRSIAPAVKANALLYAHFERPDLNRARDYLVDFGLSVAAQERRTNSSCAAPARRRTSIASAAATRRGSSASDCRSPPPTT